TGYPNGLAGESIPLPGRLMAINTVYKALTTDRPWKQALSHDDAVRVIVAGKGAQFDPALVDVFADVVGEMLPAA
ncbi:MAG: two-component system response regulator, partial [Deltaproteobacteria bacterium]|nr:two-component system response regulator [Deltaproteobacteria bacterium]